MKKRVITALVFAIFAVFGFSRAYANPLNLPDELMHELRGITIAHCGFIPESGGTIDWQTVSNKEPLQIQIQVMRCIGDVQYARLPDFSGPGQHLPNYNFSLDLYPAGEGIIIQSILHNGTFVGFSVYRYTTNDLWFQWFERHLFSYFEKEYVPVNGLVPDNPTPRNSWIRVPSRTE